LIGDLACIYQGTQDAPAGAYIIGVPAEEDPRYAIRPARHDRTSDRHQPGSRLDFGMFTAAPGPSGEERAGDDGDDR
jgi:hypothetical protein